MRRLLPLVLALLGSLVLVATVWQTARYAALAAQTRLMEQREEDWVEENRKLAAGIAVLSNRQRAEAMANSLDLEKASPERRLIIVVPAKGRGGSDG